MRVELVFFSGCPHVAAARARLAAALADAALPANWREWDTLAAATPVQYRQYGSPTVLVDGHDVMGLDTVPGPRCVVGGGPSVETIVAALRGAR